MLMLAVLIGIVLVPTGAYNPEVDVYVNGNRIEAYQPAIIVNGRTMVPLRAICEALKCDVSWNPDTRTAQIQNKLTIVAVQIDNYILSKVDRNDQKNILNVALDVPPIIYNNSTLVPARAISEALFAQVDWDGAARRVDITLEFDSVGWFDLNGLAVASKNEKYGVISENRQVLVPLEYDNARFNDMSSGLVIVEKGGKEGIVNAFRGGEIALPIKYESIDRAFLNEDNEIFAICTYEPGGFGCVDTDGNVLVPNKYDSIWYFDGKFAIVLDVRSAAFGVVDTAGNTTVPVIYKSVGEFQTLTDSGTLWFMKDDKYGLVDCSNGEVILPFIYEDIRESVLPEAAACLNGKWGMVNEKTGKTVVDFVHPDADAAYLALWK